MKHLWEEVGLKEYFDGYFCTYEIGSDKSQSEFYKFILDDLQLEPSEVLFFDDTQLNVDVARDVGIEAYFYDDIKVLTEHTRRLVD